MTRTWGGGWIVLVCGPLRVSGGPCRGHSFIGVLYAWLVSPTHGIEDECTYECKDSNTRDRASSDGSSV